MPYLAILGRQPELSLAELEALLGPDAASPFGRHAILEATLPLERLGGTIKLAEVIAEAKTIDDALLTQLLKHMPESQSKLTVGLSYYGKKQSPLRLGMELKKLFRTSGRSVRLVLPRPGSSALSAAQLKFNNLVTPESPEIIIAESNGQVLAAVTTQYQDIDAYSARDQARPNRDARVGMLPPKLAQILINLAGPDPGLVVDPFCGSGVIAQEALLLGHPVRASDLAPKMVVAATENLTWLAATRQDLPPWHVDAVDARQLSLPKEPLAIVTEGYLGPPLSGSPSPASLVKLDREISQLTKAWLGHLSGQLPSGTHVVLTLPQWQTPTGPITPQIVDEITRLGYTPKEFRRGPTELVYRRPGQIVGRRLLVLEKV